MALWPALQAPELYGGVEGVKKAVNAHYDGVESNRQKFQKILDSKPGHLTANEWFKLKEVRIISDDPLIIEGFFASLIAPELDSFPTFLVKDGVVVGVAEA